MTLSPADRRRLETLVRDRNTVQKHVWRARIVLISADGIGTNEIAPDLARSTRRGDPLDGCDDVLSGDLDATGWGAVTAVKVLAVSEANLSMLPK